MRRMPCLPAGRGQPWPRPRLRSVNLPSPAPTNLPSGLPVPRDLPPEALAKVGAQGEGHLIVAHVGLAVRQADADAVPLARPLALTA